jgi:hypothetical protein
MMKKIILMLAFMLTFTLNVIGSTNTPILIQGFGNTTAQEDSIVCISVNVPSQLYFYEVDHTIDPVIALRLRGDARHSGIAKWLVYENKNGVLHIDLKTYTKEEMNNMNPQDIRLYIPDSYYDKIKTAAGLNITISKKKNDSGRSTN